MPPDSPGSTPWPTGLTAWREALLQVRLPLLSSDNELKRLLSPQISLREALALAENDPPLALDLISMATRESRLRDGVRSLQQALNVLGIDRLQALLRARISKPAPIHAKASDLARQAMATSQLAALFAQAWGRQHRAGDEDHRSWLTRLMGAARWKLPWAHPSLSAHLEARVASGERRAQVERDLLGCHLHELNAWHLQDMGLVEASDLRHAFVLPTPQVALAARLGRAGGAAPEMPIALARLLHQPTTGCALAYALALELQTGWYSPRADQWIGVASAHLSQPVEDVRQDLIQLALMASRDTRFNDGLNPAAARLIWPRAPSHRPLPVPRHAPAQAGQAPDSPRSKPLPAAAPQTPLMRPSPISAPSLARPASPALSFEQRCEQAAFSDLPSFMQEALAHLHLDMGLQRCALFLKQAGTETLVGYVAHGFGVPVQARALQLSLEPGGLVTRLMQHPSATLWVRSQQVQAARTRLPPALAGWTTETGCLLGAVQVRAHAMGLWWADTAPGCPPIDDERLAQFGRMTQVFGAEFTRLLHLQRQRRPAASAVAATAS